MSHLLCSLALLALVVFGLPSPRLEYEVVAIQEKWRRVDRVLPWPTPALLWQGEPLVAPRGVNLFGNFLFVTDPGDRTDPTKPARIVKFTLIDGTPQDPVVFFSRPGFLFSAKWSVPTTVNGETKLIVADQGRELPDGTFTGEGGKVFLLPLLSDGTAGEPQILWQGLPFKCPTGVARVGDYIYITDPCAGPIITRPESPNHPFPSSAIFALRITGGEQPILIQSGSPYTSLIGICPDNPGQLIVTDTDSGRIDPTETGGRPGFAPPGSADRWILRILDQENARLSAPVRTRFTEEGPLTLQFTNLPDDAMITLTSGPTNLILDLFNQNRPSHEITFPASNLDDDGTITITAVSDVLSNYVCTFVRVTTDSSLSATDSTPQRIDLFKDEQQPPMLADNKHGGSKRVRDVAAATSQEIEEVFDYFTMDSAPGQAAIWIYPQGGGTPVAMSQGAPLVRPIAGQLSEDFEKLWIVDQATGSLYVVPFPGSDVFNGLFPFRFELRDVEIVQKGFRRNRTTGRYLQEVTLTNPNATGIKGPVSLVLDELSTNVSLFNKTGITVTGSPYINAQLAADNLLGAGETVTLVLQFVNPTNSSITYKPRVIVGYESR